MLSIAEKIIDAVAPDIDGRVTAIADKLDKAREALAAAHEAHGVAALAASEPDAPKRAASDLTTAHRALEDAHMAFTDAEAALVAAKAAKARQEQAEASAARRAKREAVEKAYSADQKAAAEMSQALDVLVAKSHAYVETHRELLALAPEAVRAGVFNDAALMFPAVVGHRLRHVGLKSPAGIMDAARLENWMASFPGAEQVLKYYIR